MKLNKIALIISMMIFAVTHAFCQKVKNFSNQTNDNGSYTTDFLQIGLQKHNDAVISDKGATILPGLIGAVATIGIDIYKAEHDKKVATYSATTNNSASFGLKSSEVDDFNGGKKYIEIKRYGLDKLTNNPDEKNLLETYDIDIVKINGALKFTLTKFKIIYSKAFVKKEEYIAVGLDIKLTAGTGSASADTSAKGKSTSATNNLGEGTIKIPLTQTVASNGDFVEINNSTIVNPIVFPMLKGNSDGTPTIVTFTVTLTEANISRLKSSVVDGLLKNNSSDITSLIKAFFPSSSSGKN